MQRHHDTRQQKPRPQRPARRSRGGATIALLVGLAAALTLVGVIVLYRQRPDLYDPARSALVEADLHISRAYGHERTLLQQLHEGRRELDTALTYLEHAAHVDPALRIQIEPLRNRLRTLQDDTARGRLSTGELHHSYQELLARVEALIRTRP